MERFGDLAWEHPLRRELLATLAANDVVDTMGESFVFRRALEFGASASAVVRAFLIARDVCEAPALIRDIERLEVDPDTRWGLSAIVQDAVRQVRPLVPAQRRHRRPGPPSRPSPRTATPPTP